MIDDERVVSTIVPYGSWPSSICSAVLVEAVFRLGDVAVHGDEIWWVEGRPSQGGSQVVLDNAAALRVAS